MVRRAVSCTPEVVCFPNDVGKGPCSFNNIYMQVMYLANNISLDEYSEYLNSKQKDYLKALIRRVFAWQERP